MRNKEFLDLVAELHKKDVEMLNRKQSEYSMDELPRHSNFYRAGQAQGIPPSQALLSMAMKHILALCDMVKSPMNFPQENWHERCMDIRNYCFLLETLLIDMRCKERDLEEVPEGRKER